MTTRSFTTLCRCLFITARERSRGNMFGLVCLCLSVHGPLYYQYRGPWSVYPVRTLTFESRDLETSFSEHLGQIRLPRSSGRGPGQEPEWDKSVTKNAHIRRWSAFD